ncbi:tRNA sulfurtransferase [Stetteria hydrogenophila]
MRSVVLVRYSEIAVKGRATRSRMESLLRSNLEEALRSQGVGYGGIVVDEGRIIILDAGPDAARAAARVFGVKSTSPAVEVRFNSLEDIVESGAAYFCSRVRGRKFRVRARRAGVHDFTSKDVERLLGARLLESCGASGVDLTNPEYSAYVEVRRDRAYFYDEIIEGPGGLPLGSEGKVLLLFSGGFDSTASAWLIMKRGAPVDLLLYDYGHPTFRRTAVKAAKILAESWAYGYDMKLVVADFRRVVERLASVKPEYRVLVARRVRLLYAHKVAGELGADALATGDSIGQVASQTLANMKLIEGSLELPVLRPVIAFDKDEVVALTRRIGTYDVNASQIEVCGLGSPATPRADPEVFERELRKLSDYESLITHKVFALKEGSVEEIISSIEHWLLRDER